MGACIGAIVQAFEREQLQATPWKNGGGVTRELACWPPGAGIDRFDWRVSIAHIGCSGPFSAFPGVDRIITLLEGSGVRLHTPDGGIDHRLDQPWQPFAFAGELPVQADLLGADCHDFNVMTRRGICCANVAVLREPADLGVAEHGVLMALQGHWRASQAGQVWTLAPGAGVWWHHATHAWQLQTQDTGAALLAVQIRAIDALGGGRA